MNSRFRLSTGSLIGVVLIAGISIYLSFYPLWHTDVWAHAKYGEWYWTHRELPKTEPLSPFSDKETPFANVAWLSQLVYYGLYEFGATIAGGDAESQLRGGAEALRTFHLLLLVARLVLLWLALRKFGGSPTWASLGVFLYFFAVGIGSAVQRPQAFGLFFFTAIIYALSSPTLSKRAIIWLPTMFLLWANLHGTFMAGLLVLGLHTIGRAIERGVRDRDLHHLAIVCVLCGLATFVNPHGPLLIRYLLAFSSHPNLQTMSEWFPMRIKAEGGGHWPYLMSLILLAFVRILGGRKVGIAGWLVALPFALWPFLQARMLLWWWTVAVWLLARLGPGLADRFPTLPSLADRPPTRVNAWIAVFFIVIALLLLPPVRCLLPGSPRDVEHTVAVETPWRLALELNPTTVDDGRLIPDLRAALNEHYPGGRFTGSIFASETQGDFLIWALPSEIPVMMFTHAHVFTPEYWNACVEAELEGTGWRELLVRYRANLIVVEINSHQEFVMQVQHDQEWIVVQPNARTDQPQNVLVALRKKPI